VNNINCILDWLGLALTGSNVIDRVEAAKLAFSFGIIKKLYIKSCHSAITRYYSSVLESTIIVLELLSVNSFACRMRMLTPA
jgi:hypothetical protein